MNSIINAINLNINILIIMKFLKSLLFPYQLIKLIIDRNFQKFSFFLNSKKFQISLVDLNLRFLEYYI